MSDIARAFEEWVQKMAGTYLKDKRISVPATVESIEMDTLSCTVITIGDDASVTIPGVLLSAEVSDGFVVIPAVNSTVYIALTTRNHVFIEMYSDLSAVMVSIPTGTPGVWTKLLINDTGIVMNDGSYGGLVEVIPLVSAISTLQNQINNLKALFNSHIHPTPSGPSSVTGTPDTDPVITPTVRGDVENTLITHGH